MVFQTRVCSCFWYDDKLRVMKICQRWVYNVLEVTNWIAQPIMSKQDDCAKLRFKVWHGLRMKEHICADVSHNFPTMNNTWGLHLVKMGKYFLQKSPNTGILGDTIPDRLTWEQAGNWHPPCEKCVNLDGTSKNMGCMGPYILTGYIWFVWSKTSFSGDKWRCHRCGTGGKNKRTKKGRY